MNRVPEISDEILAQMLKHIRPMVSRNGKLFYIKPCDPRKVAFPWAKLDGEAEGLSVLAEIPTYHTYGYYGMFKPSLAEVLAQIPAEHVGRCCAFVTKGPEDSNDLNAQMDIVNEGYHRAVTTLYEMPEAPVARSRYTMAKEAAGPVVTETPHPGGGVDIAITCESCGEPLTRTSAEWGMDCENRCGEKETKKMLRKNPLLRLMHAYLIPPKSARGRVRSHGRQ